MGGLLCFLVFRFPVLVIAIATTCVMYRAEFRLKE